MSTAVRRANMVAYITFATVILLGVLNMLMYKANVEEALLITLGLAVAFAAVAWPIGYLAD